MFNKDQFGGDCVTKNMPGRQQRKTMKKLKRALLNMESDHREADAKMRNSRAARLHQIQRRPGRGGLSAVGAEQLRQYFSKKVSKDEKLSMGAMDPTASMTVLQMAAEEVDSAAMTYGELEQVAEETIMACGGGKREAAVKVRDGMVEEIMQSEKAMKAEGDMELEEDGMGEEDWEQGGVALAKDY